MAVFDLGGLTEGLSSVWAGFLRDWDRSLRSVNHPETTRYNYLLAAQSGRAADAAGGSGEFFWVSCDLLRAVDELSGREADLVLRLVVEVGSGADRLERFAGRIGADLHRLLLVAQETSTSSSQVHQQLGVVASISEGSGSPVTAYLLCSRGTARSPRGLRRRSPRSRTRGGRVRRDRRPPCRCSLRPG